MEHTSSMFLRRPSSERWSCIVTQKRPLGGLSTRFTSSSRTGTSHGRFAAISLTAVTHPTFRRSSNAVRRW